MEKNDSRGGSQSLLLKLPHAAVSRGALRDTQKHGVLGGEGFDVNGRTLDRVRQQLPTCVKQEDGAYSGQFFAYCAEKPPEFRLHVPA